MNRLLLALSAFLGSAAAAHAQKPVLAVPQTAAPDQVEHVALADFNGDGKLDVATAQPGSSFFPPPQAVSVHLGTGTGLFGAPLHLDAGSGLVGGLVAADLDLDGNVDLCTTVGTFTPTLGGRVSRWLGNGAGGFGPRADFAVDSIPSAIVLADLDLDGLKDAITANHDTGAGGAKGLSVLFGRVGGGFRPPIYYSHPISPRSVEAGDLNGDGLLDVAAISYVTFGPQELVFLQVRLGVGGGALGAPTTTTLGENTRSVRLADVDGDGDLDATTVRSGSTAGELNILRNDGAAAFPVSDFHPYSGEGWGHVTVDLDGDGALDVVVADPTGHGVDVFKGPLTAGFGNPARYPAGLSPHQIVLGDVNADGLPDAVTTLSQSDSFATLLGQGAGTFSAIPSLSTNTDARALAFGDLDGDGLPDAVAAYFGTSVIFPVAGGLSVFLGSAGGSFLPRVDFPAGSMGVAALALGDLNGDGALDAVAVNQPLGLALVYVGNGAGGFASPAHFATGANPAGVAVADLDLDGKPDAVSANSGAATLSFLAGDGAGGLAAPVALPAGTGVSSVVTGDLDDNGRPDLVCANTGASTMSVLLASPTGGFLPKVDYATPASPLSVAIGDGNFDGKLDVAVGSSTTPLVSHRAGVGGGALGPATDSAMAPNAGAAFYQDFDGDGRHDLASVSTSGQLVSIRAGDGTGAFGARVDYAADTIGSGVSGPSAGAAAADWNADGRSDLGVVTRFVFTALENKIPPAPSTTLFGPGTPGCGGTLGVAVSGAPKIGTSPFRFMSTQAPPDSLGLGVLSSGAIPAGADLFGIGILCHVDFGAPSVLAFNAYTDPAGIGFVDFPIPSNPLLVGTTAHFQAYYVSLTCLTTLFGLMSTRGLSLTFLP